MRKIRAETVFERVDICKKSDTQNMFMGGEFEEAPFDLRWYLWKVASSLGP